MRKILIVFLGGKICKKGGNYSTAAPGQIVEFIKHTFNLSVDYEVVCLKDAKEITDSDIAQMGNVIRKSIASHVLVIQDHEKHSIPAETLKDLNRSIVFLGSNESFLDGGGQTEILMYKEQFKAFRVENGIYSINPTRFTKLFQEQ